MAKVCQYPGCTEGFMGVGKAKYCEEHRKPVYRKVLDAKEIQAKRQYIKDNNINQTINHKLCKCELTIMKCALEGCDEEFKVLFIPSVNVYPKYCPEHRCEHKRIMFLEKQKI